MLQPRILPLSILPNHNNIHILMPRRQPIHIKTIHKRNKQIQLFPQRKIQRVNPSTHRCNQPAFQTNFSLLNRIHNIIRNLVHVPMHVKFLKRNRRLHGVEHLFYRPGDQRANTVTGDQCNGPRNTVGGDRGDGFYRVVSGSGHVGYGADA
ncbi:hypothetical protein HanRHA438_Chr07g0305141 [Helianthus annuus]|nr:hypothetical protein HanIR_Chr07g0318241 [Helianthus annuus]KAJ0907968.1 hypothetical protein HanRHA438_Chr07g0305141 [Helianthus annuus]